MEDITRSFLTRPQLELYKREATWAQEGFVSISVPEGPLATGIVSGECQNLTKKKEHFQVLSLVCKQVHEPIVYQPWAPQTYMFRGFYGKSPGFSVAKTSIFSWFWVLMEDIASLVSRARLVGLTIPRFGIHGLTRAPLGDETCHGFVERTHRTGTHPQRKNG